MKVVLLGFDFVCPNKGCEALSYSFLNVLKKYYKDEKIDIYNVTYKDSMGLIPEMYCAQFAFTNWRIHFKSPKYIIETIKLFKSADIIFDITYGDSFSDIYGKQWLVKTNIHKWIAEKFNGNLILLPQTYGPFSDYFLKKWSIQIIKNARYVYSRDNESINYLKKYNIENVVLATDLAMALPYNSLKVQNSVNIKVLNIGINVSSLLWENGFTGKNEFGLTVDYKKYCKTIISKLLQKGYKVHLIPHVIDGSQNAPEDDWRPIKKLKEMYPQVEVPHNSKTPVEIKSYISNMDIFVGARMHSTIAAFSSKVPVIPFSYSRKFEGLFGNLDYKYVIDGRKLSTDDAVRLTLEWIENRNELLVAEEKGMYKVENLLNIFEKRLDKNISEIM